MQNQSCHQNFYNPDLLKFPPENLFHAIIIMHNITTAYTHTVGSTYASKIFECIALSIVSLALYKV